MTLTSSINEIAKVDLREAQRIAFEAVGENGRKRFFEFRGRQACIARAQSKPLPGESRGAFLNSDIKVGDKSIHRLVPRHFIILEAMDSPLLKMMEQATAEKKSGMEWTANQEFEVCYLFTHDIKETFKTFKEKGARAIQDLAEAEVIEWDAEIIRFVTMAVIEQLKRHVETKVRIAAELEKDGQISFFREQKVAASKLTALDGSSTTSADTGNTIPLIPSTS